MAAIQHLVKELEGLDENQLQEVEIYLKFLKFRSGFVPSIVLSEEQIAKLYGKFAEEDRLLAEEGISDYTSSLLKEDTQ